MAASTVSVSVNQAQLQAARAQLARWRGAQLSQALGRATYAAAEVTRAAVVAATPGRNEQIAASTKLHRVPGGYRVHVHDYRAGWITGGTKPHRIKARRKKALGGGRFGHPVRPWVQHPGARANPYVARAARAAEGAARAAALRYLTARAAARGRL